MHWPHHQSPGLCHYGPLSSCESWVNSGIVYHWVLSWIQWFPLHNRYLIMYPFLGFPLWGVVSGWMNTSNPMFWPWSDLIMLGSWLRNRRPAIRNELGRGLSWDNLPSSGVDPSVLNFSWLWASRIETHETDDQPRAAVTRAQQMRICRIYTCLCHNRYV